MKKMGLFDQIIKKQKPNKEDVLKVEQPKEELQPPTPPTPTPKPKEPEKSKKTIDDLAAALEVLYQSILLINQNLVYTSNQLSNIEEKLNRLPLVERDENVEKKEEKK